MSGNRIILIKNTLHSRLRPIQHRRPENYLHFLYCIYQADKIRDCLVVLLLLPVFSIFTLQKPTMAVSIKDLYDILSVKLGKEEAKTLVTFIEDKVEKHVDHRLENVVTSGEFQKGLNDLERNVNAKLWTAFITLIVMMLGLYATIIFKK